MMNIKEIKSILLKMVKILQFGELNDWVIALKKLEEEVQNSPMSVSSEILSMFGGMGSLNDIVLYKNGLPLITENDELDDLRTKLYQLCHG